MAAVRGGIEQGIGRAAFEAAVENRFEGFVAGFVAVEAQVVAIDDEAFGAVHEKAQKNGQGGDVLAGDFDEDEAGKP